MKYSDVVDIPAPLETVKQVRDSDTVEVAEAMLRRTSSLTGWHRS